MKMILPTRLILTAAALLVACATQASGLNKGLVGADAKWLLHIDLERFRGTKVGAEFDKELVEKQVEQVRADTGGKLNIPFSKITGLTAYGTQYSESGDNNGVLLLEMDKQAQNEVEDMLMSLKAVNPSIDVKKLEGAKSALGTGASYSIGADLHVLPHQGNTLLISKSPTHLKQAAEVVSGKAANYGANGKQLDIPNAADTFFLLAVAQGFNENTPLPPQAKILQMSESARITLGEKDDNLMLNLVLNAKNEEVSDEIQQIIQGFVALVSLTQRGNPDIYNLVRSSKVSNDNKIVSVSINYPVAKAIKDIQKKSEENIDKDKGAEKAKGSEKEKSGDKAKGADKDKDANKKPENKR